MAGWAARIGGARLGVVARVCFGEKQEAEINSTLFIFSRCLLYLLLFSHLIRLMHLPIFSYFKRHFYLFWLFPVQQQKQPLWLLFKKYTYMQKQKPEAKETENWKQKTENRKRGVAR